MALKHINLGLLVPYYTQDVILAYTLLFLAD